MVAFDHDEKLRRLDENGMLQKVLQRPLVAYRPYHTHHELFNALRNRMYDSCNVRSKYAKEIRSVMENAHETLALIVVAQTEQ